MTTVRQPAGKRGLGGSGWVAVGCLSLAVALVLARFKSGEAADDIFITYRYAMHIAAGLGLVFNPGERVFGVSDPGMAVLLGILRAVFEVDIPAAGTVGTALALWAIAALVVAEGRRRGRLPEAVAGAAAVAVFPALWMGQGSGPLPALAFLLAAARLAPERPVVAGLAAGAAVWCRPDAVLGAGLLAWFLRRRPPAGSRYSQALAASVGVGILGAYVAFGTLVPNTLVAKRLFAANDPGLFGRVEFWRRAYGLFDWSAGHAGWLLIAAAVWGLVELCRADSLPLRLLALYGVLSGVFYTAVGVPFFVWYTAPLMVAVLVAAAWALGKALRAVTRGRPRLEPAGIALACAAVLVPASLTAWKWFQDPVSDWRLWGYRVAGEWIAAHTPADADVALDEVGILGYFSGRPVRDLVGLVSPELLPFATVGDARGAFLSRPAELVVFHTFSRRGGTRPIVEAPWFAAAYREAVRFTEPASGRQVLVYRRIAGGPPLPASRPPRARRPGV